MTAAAYATNLTTFWLEGATTVTAIGTGGAGLGNPETDFFIQGTDCISKGGWTNAIKGFIVDNDGAGNITVPTSGAIIFFAKYDAQGSLDTQANGGFQFIHGNTSSAYDHCYIGGKDTIAFNSWVPYVIDPGTATADTTTSTGASGTHRWAGILADLPTTSGPTKGNPIAMDAIRYGRCDVEYTLGDVTPNGPATFDGAEGTGNVVGTRWGLIELLDGAFQMQGFHSIGVSGTAVDFRDADKVMFWRKQENNLTNDAIATAFNRVEIIHASTICQWTNIIWSALGTRSPGTFVHTAGTCDLESCQFFDWGSFTFLAAANITNCVFSRSLAVTAPGTDMTGSSILTPNISANTSGLIWNVNTDPTGLLDDMTFTKTAGTAHHAIEFGVDIPTTNITLNNCDFGTDFSAGLDTTVGDETFHFLDTTGTLTLNLVGCTGNKGYRSEGVVITIVDDPVTTQYTVTTSATPPVVIEGSRVLLEASDGTGPLPFEEAVTITQTAGTATVTHTAHGIPDGTNVVIRGADQNGYNKVAVITVTTANEYTYAVDSGTVSPSTGTEIASGVIIHDTTNASGIVSDVRVLSGDQPFKGTIRDSSGSPYYQPATVTGIVSSTTGFTATIALLSDE